MEYEIRDIDPTNQQEISLAVKRAVETVLETIPEFKGDSKNALNAWPILLLKR